MLGSQVTDHLGTLCLKDVSQTRIAPRAPPAPPEPPEKMDASILVIDTSDALAEGLKSVMGGVAPIRLVSSPVDAVRALGAEEVAAIVADLSAGQDGLVTLFKILKAEHPEVLSILVTEASDSELVIELINQAKIFRFLNKPIQVRQLRHHVDAALAKYRAFKRRPDLVRDQRPAESLQAKTSLWGARLFESIRSLPQRLFSRS